MAVTRIIGSVVYLTVLFCSIGATVIAYQNTTAEYVLRKKILSNYDRLVIPTNRDTFLTVDFDLRINSAVLDYEKSQMTINAWFTIKWNDHRLSWDPEQYGQVDRINVDYNEIWHPDITVYNSEEINMNDVNFNVILSSTGSLVSVDPVRFIVHCQTDTTKWPHDTQTAEVSIGSWTYAGNALNLTSSYDNNDANSKNSEWKILKVTKKRQVTYYTCCPNEPYIDIKYSITIKRNVHVYQSIIYIPALCSVTLHLITFWLPHSDKHLKLFANMINTLFIALTILAMYSKIPAVTSSVPLIIVYYTYSLGLVSMTAALSVAIKHMSAVSKPLPHNVTRFLHSKHLAYLGIETNNSTVDIQVLNESGELNVQKVDLNQRQKLARVIDRICFVAFAFIYLILLLCYMP